MAAVILATQRQVGASYQQTYRKVALSSVSSSSAWIHLTAPPQMGRRDGGGLISFLKALLTIDNVQAPLPDHPGTARRAFPTQKLSSTARGAHIFVRTDLDDLCPGSGLRANTPHSYISPPWSPFTSQTEN